MITYGFVFKDGNLEMQVDCRGTRRSVATRYEVRESEWDPHTRWVVLPDNNSVRRRKLMNYERGMTRDMRVMSAIVNDYQHRRFTADDIVNDYRAAILGHQMLGIYASALADELKRAGQPRTARGYTGTVRRFIDFNRGHDIRLDDINQKIIDAFQASLKGENLTLSTLSFYMRNLRAIYNKAIAERLIPARLDDPFEDACVEIYLSAC